MLFLYRLQQKSDHLKKKKKKNHFCENEIQFTTIPGKTVTQISIAVFVRILTTWFVLHVVPPSILTLRVEQYSLLSCSTILYILSPPPTHFSLSHPWQQHHHQAHRRGWDCQAFITTLSLLLFWPKKVNSWGDVTSNPEWLYIGQYCQVQTKCRDTWLAWDTSFFLHQSIYTWVNKYTRAASPILAYMVFFNITGHMWETLNYENYVKLHIYIDIRNVSAYSQ